MTLILPLVLGLAAATPRSATLTFDDGYPALAMAVLLVRLHRDGAR